MNLIHDDGKVTDAVGLVDLGNLAIPRKKLAEMFPDIDRFERCLATALYINEHDGAWPPGWNPTKAEGKDVVNTMRELAAIELDATDKLKAELARRFA